jgi:hypothetical protein
MNGVAKGFAIGVGIVAAMVFGMVALVAGLFALMYVVGPVSV